MDPSTWGPHAWKTLHAIAAHCDSTNEVQTFGAYVNSFQAALPCKACRDHMQEYLRDNPVPSRNFFAYTVTFHNAVNKRLGKPEVNEEAARASWSVSCNDSCNETSTPSIWGPVLVYMTMFLSVFIIFFFLKRYNAVS